MVWKPGSLLYRIWEDDKSLYVQVGSKEINFQKGKERAELIKKLDSVDGKPVFFSVYEGVDIIWPSWNKKRRGAFIEKWRVVCREINKKFKGEGLKPFIKYTPKSAGIRDLYKRQTAS